MLLEDDGVTGAASSELFDILITGDLNGLFRLILPVETVRLLSF